MPMNWKRILAYIAGSVDQELVLRNEYLVTENRLLRNQIKGRILLSDAERISLAQIVRLETILAYSSSITGMPHEIFDPTA
jgi:hypothetical protein